MITIGYCGTCKYRDERGYCMNDKLDDDFGQSPEQKADMLLYSYSESGAFFVGPNFGCVHYTAKPETHQE